MKYIARLATIAPLAYIGIVVYLHIIQSNHDPVNQFMSELAMGMQGWLMLYAFCSLGISLSALSIGLFLSGAKNILSALLLIGAAGFIGAGIVRLDENINIHIALTVISFVTVALSMYLLPFSSKLFKEKNRKTISWILAIGLGVSVALGAGIISNGVGQRFSALFLILWLIWVGAQLAKYGEQHHS